MMGMEFLILKKKRNSIVIKKEGFYEKKRHDTYRGPCGYYSLN
jgi:hypothetical protein